MWKVYRAGLAKVPGGTFTTSSKELGSKELGRYFYLRKFAVVKLQPYLPDRGIC
jgi:hypothetical protein